MKKTVILMIVLMVGSLASVAAAGDKGAGMVGRLFLFQKCAIVENDDLPGYDESGCPDSTFEGPWPILTQNRRWGQMKYNILGPEFKYSFQGKNLDPDAGYTLIYYPDPWPGKNLICLGNGKATKGGSVQIHGKMSIPGGLPQENDANYHNPEGDSSAVGAKVWLVLKDDVECGSPASRNESGEEIEAVQSEMLGWNPVSYLFEGNLIIYQPTETLDGEGEGEDDGSLGNGEESEEDQEPGEEEAATIKRSMGKAYGKDKQK